jgi:6-phosphogluconolactonase
MKIEVFSDDESTARAAEKFVAAEAAAAVAARGHFVMAVSGGRTPWIMLRALGNEEVQWERVHVVQVDERVAPVEHPDRNLAHLRETLLDHSPIRPEQIHAMPVESPDLEAAARRYASTLGEIAGSPPMLGLVHLGLGPDGHTASLVPGDPVLNVNDVDVAVTGVYQGRRRMTLTYPIINRGRRILWLVTGNEKVGALLRMRSADPSIPAGRICQDRAVIFADRAAAAIENNRRQRQLQDSKIQRAAAGIDQANAQIAAAQAGKEAAQADVTRTRAERTRQEALLKANSATQQKVETAVADEQRFAAQATSRDADVTQARTLLRSNELGVEAERRGRAVLESQEMQLLADLHAKQAGLAVAQVNLNYTRIVAPANGTVGERQVRPGQLVSPGTQVMSFVESTRWVQANFRETQLTNIKVGDTAEIRIDVYPGRLIGGKVLEIAPASGSQFALLPPDNATGNFTKVVQRVPVKIALDDSDLTARLRPGLSAVVTVRTRR